jgi:hypothetical protein
VPSFTVQDGVERGTRRGNLAARERPQNDGMVAFLEHRFFRDLLVARIAEARHQLAVLGVGLRLFLFQPMKDDRRVAYLLEPGQAALDFPGIRNTAG